jgi:hypothetical protein
MRLRDDLHVVDVRQISRHGVDDRGVIVSDDAAVLHVHFHSRRQWAAG